jgi:CDP-diacylglycerol--serine O-phosphatidyltransferase
MILSFFKKQAANILTFTGMVIGLFAIIKSIEGNFKISAFLIVVAAIFDFSDGFVARKLNITSNFGKYLDSNSDLIAFGVAPGLLIYLSVLHQFHLIGVLVSFLFISGGVFRLARYNATQFSGSYVGLPITIAGSFLALSTFLNSYLPPMTFIFISLLLAGLMVSTYSFKKF